jgi:hypothetical protein
MSDSCPPESEMSNSCPPESEMSDSCPPECGKVRYGKINEKTGKLEKKRCKKHKEKDDVGLPPPWKKRWLYAKKIVRERGYILEETETTWIEGTTAKGRDFIPRMSCPEGHLVTGTSINNFVNHTNGCPECAGL